MVEAIKKYLNNINWKAFTARFAIGLVSTVLSELGIGCFYACGLGTDPISVFVDGLHFKFDLSYGTISTICYVILTILIIIFERKYLGINTILGMFIGGPLIDLFEGLISRSFPLETTSFAIRLIILIIGVITFGISCGMGIAIDLGIGCFQFAPIFLSDISKIELKWTQVITDAMFFIIGIVLGGVIGVGTIVSTLLTGPLLDIGIKQTEKFQSRFGPLYKNN